MFQPLIMIVSGSLKNPHSMLLRLSNDCLKVLEPGSNINSGRLTFLERLGTVLEQLGLESIANFLDNRTQTVSLVKDDEDALVDQLALNQAPLGKLEN